MSNKPTKKTLSPRSSPLLQFFNRSSSNASNNNNDDNHVIQSPNSTFSEQSASSTFLRSLSKCFDGAMEDAITDEEEAIAASEGNNSKGREGGMRQFEIPKWGPSHSMSDDDSDDNIKKCAKIQRFSKGSDSPAATGFTKTFKPVSNPSKHLTTISSSVKDAIVPTPTSSSNHSSCNKTQRSNSNTTAQTSPITTSTNDPAAQENSLSIKTGMQSSSVGSTRHQHQTNNSFNTYAPKTPSAMPSTPNTNSGAAIRAAAGAGGVSMSNFWNFNVKPFSTDENNTPTNCGPLSPSGHAFNGTTTSVVSPSSCSPLENALSTPMSTESNDNAATSPLLSRPAKAAADAVLGMFESISNRVNQVSSHAEKLFIPAASQLCGPNSPKNGEPDNCALHESYESTSTMPNERSGGRMLEKIPENLRVCGNFDGGDGDFNDEVDFDNDREDYSCWRNTRHSSTSWTTTTADGVPPNSPEKETGYEIRLKSTFSRMEIVEKRKKKEIKQQEQHQQSFPTLPNLPLNDIDEAGGSKTTNTPSQPNSSAVRTSNPSRTPSAFGRTHPNRSQSPSHHMQNHTSSAMDPSSSQQSRAFPQGLPFEYLEVPSMGENDIERSVSELTMRSHGAYDKHRYSSDSRRMAYYAVGRVNQDKDAIGNTRGGKRRCYFTGNPIPYGLPFYAGSVQQGPRTLVVFCLPSALGLPSLHPQPLHHYSKEDRERYLQTLPEPNEVLLGEMRRRYPEPFETLPVQVGLLTVGVCLSNSAFFSGLPIAEGEMHYLVKSAVKTTPSSPGQEATHEFEEIALSHEVLEAVNGVVSAEILRLPNQKTFDYLQRQYCQQSAKLHQDVFDRSSWEIVLPEV
eukprot:CAMPEP_0171388742 /NCGR_PEP_ID=MMETSP0879-20121228/40664_1 /TAXON_ID=67004 /ORGANISM="Thalassiosira weissflogii, Strain CCMP1336" /LENGTH=849 /DNA_ID=CAMNT_0011901097 /DNA_START=207 /DNA_END=2757 /DNA_ORIENTATION=-